MMHFMLRAFAQLDLSPLPHADANDVQVKTILQIVFVVAGAVAVIVVAVAGLNYVISSGDPQKTAKAKDTILYALIGLAISILAFTIVTFVLGKLFS